MREPFVVEGRDLLQVRKIAQRQEILHALVILLPGCGGFLVRLRTGKIFAAADVRSDIEPDPIEPRAVKDAAGIEEIARSGKRHGGDHGFQMRRIFDGGEPLDRAGIGEAKGADVAVGPGLLRGPLDGVVAVAAFVLIGREIAVGSVAAADVLDDDGVTACDRFFESLCLRSARIPCRRACDRRVWGSGRRAGSTTSARRTTPSRIGTATSLAMLRDRRGLDLRSPEKKGQSARDSK